MRKATLLLVVLFVCAAVSAHAITVTWNGNSGGSANWSDPFNWVSNIQPQLSPPSLVVLAGTNKLNSNVDTPRTIGGLSFNSTAGSFTLFNQVLTLGASGITNNSANSQTIANGLALSTTQSWNTAAGNVNVSGAVAGSNTTLTKTGAATLTLSGTAANTNLGVFDAEGGTTVLNKTAGVDALSGNLTVGNATVQLAADNQINDAADVTISNAGGLLDVNSHQETINSLSGTGSVNLGSTGRLTIFGSQDTTYSGAISGNGGGITLKGSGSLTLSGINTYTGDTILQGGTLRLGANQTLQNLSNLTLAGGKLQTAGFNQDFGVLTLTADSTVDMSGGASLLKFQNSTASAWNNSSILTISGWNGTPVTGGGAEQFLVGASGLNTAQVGQIKFFDPAGLAPGTYDATLLLSGEVVPVPEPATIGVGVALMGILGVGVAKRRRAAK